MVLSVIGEHNAANNRKSKLASMAPCSALKFTYFSKLLIDQRKTKFTGLPFEKEDFKTVKKLLKEDINTSKSFFSLRVCSCRWRMTSVIAKLTAKLLAIFSLNNQKQRKLENKSKLTTSPTETTAQTTAQRHHLSSDKNLQISEPALSPELRQASEKAK